MTTAGAMRMMGTRIDVMMNILGGGDETGGGWNGVRIGVGVGVGLAVGLEVGLEGGLEVGLEG